MKLDDAVSTLPFVGPSYEKKLEKLGIRSIENLLHHVPRRYLDFRNTTDIAQANPGETVTIKGK